MSGWTLITPLDLEEQRQDQIKQLEEETGISAGLRAYVELGQVKLYHRLRWLVSRGQGETPKAERVRECLLRTHLILQDSTMIENGRMVSPLEIFEGE